MIMISIQISVVTKNMNYPAALGRRRRGRYSLLIILVSRGATRPARLLNLQKTIFIDKVFQTDPFRQ